MDCGLWIVNRGLRVLAVMPLIAIVGCGGDGGASSKEVSQFICGVADVMDNPATFDTVFATGATPVESQRANYRRYTYWTNDVDVSGDSATADVEISDFSDKVVATLQWTALREGGNWKLKDAPLP